MTATTRATAATAETRYVQVKGDRIAHRCIGEGGPLLLKKLKATQTPILILCGDNDTSVLVENWYPLIGEIPRGQLIVFPEAGHGPQHQYPVLSARYVAAFLDSAD